MDKIVTLTLNPSIDKSTSVDSVVPEAKLRCEEPMYEPGGGGINVSRALKKLGMDSQCVYLSGGYTGVYFDSLIENQGIKNTPLKIKGNTRENLIVVDKANNNQYRFGMEGPLIEEFEWKNCLDQISKFQNIVFLVASGSLPKGVPIDFYAQVAHVCKKNNIKMVLDTSGDALKEACDEGIYLLKPNINELSKLIGVAELQIDDVEQKAMEMITKGYCEMVVVSLGSQGAFLVSKQKSEKIPAAPVKKLSTVGAGDSMVAGMVFSLALGKSHSEAARYGVSCGTAATMNWGTELCKKEDVENLYAWVNKELNK